MKALVKKMFDFICPHGNLSSSNDYATEINCTEKQGKTLPPIVIET